MPHIYGLAVRPHWLPFGLIFTVWSLLPTTMLVLQLLGFEFGFAIRPLGEFKDWINLLQSSHGFDAAKVFWSWDHRNVLLPWWYMAARPFILAVPPAPLILHLFGGLFVGLTAYLLFSEVTRSPPFALSVGILCALFIPDVRRDDVIWVLIAALGCTLLSIWLFARFCNYGRTNAGFLSASYLVWFIALGTYTLQAGAIAGVFFVSYRNRRSLNGAIADVLPYASLFLLFVMIWITSTPPAPGLSEMYRLGFSVDAFVKTIAYGMWWNASYEAYWIWLGAAGPLLMAAVFAILAPLIFFLIRAAAVEGSRIGEAAKPPAKSLGFALLIGVCVVAPTVIVEAASATWFPGSRWPMLLQFWTPFAFCVMVFAAIARAPDRLWRPLWQSVVACAAASVILLVLGFNRTQVIAFTQG
jgi:hypothetical protein